MATLRCTFRCSRFYEDTAAWIEPSDSDAGASEFPITTRCDGRLPIIDQREPHWRRPAMASTSISRMSEVRSLKLCCGSSIATCEFRSAVLIVYNNGEIAYTRFALDVYVVQRIAAAAWFQPSPELIMTTWSPRLTLPSSIASSNAIGMQAEPV
jgi:hypothetical protein